VRYAIALEPLGQGERIAGARAVGRDHQAARAVRQREDPRYVLALDDALRARVTACTKAQAQRWFDRALTATTLAAIFDEP
jgi:hypothetical protein